MQCDLGTIAITIVDWAHEEVQEDTLQLLADRGVKATLFATHASPQLRYCRGDRQFELGIHPNFNPLLDVSADGRNVDCLGRGAACGTR